MSLVMIVSVLLGSLGGIALGLLLVKDTDPGRRYIVRMDAGEMVCFFYARYINTHEMLADMYRMQYGSALAVQGGVEYEGVKVETICLDDKPSGIEFATFRKGK